MKQNNIFFRYFSPVAAQQKLYAAALVKKNSIVDDASIALILPALDY